MEEGYFSRRLDELEQRRIELLAQRKINKMSLDGVNKEIEACKEAMNNQTNPVSIYNTSRDTKILSLTNQLDEANEVNNLLKKEVTQLKHDLFVANQEIKRLKQKFSIDDVPDYNDTHSPISSKKENIFDEFLK